MKKATFPQKPELADIFSLFGQAYRKKHRLPPQHRKVMFAIEACRTAVLGGHVYSCDNCDHKQIAYNSCRNRHCPKCQALKRETWVEKLSCTLLPVKYFHVVFTIPPELNRLCLINQRVMYDILFQAASQTILALASDKKRLGVLTGLVAVLHTWGQNLSDHPHLHTLVPAGGWSEWNGYWKKTRKNFFISVKVMSRVFRGKFLFLLKNAFNEGQLKFEGDIKPLARKEAFKNMLNALYARAWVVYSKQPFKNASGIIKYLGNYSHRVAISNDRIQHIENGRVTFGWKDYRSGGRRKTMTLSAEEFIRRFLLHVLPNGFCKIRYYGLFASRSRSFLKKCRRAMAIREQVSKFVGKDWKEILKIVTGHDALLCPACRKGLMNLTMTFAGKRGPP